MASNPESVAIIRRQFAMKNTMGYGVNALLDFDSPVDMLAHLIIGSEGTLAFVASATYRTVPVKPAITTALAVFPNLDEATRALPALVETGAATLELMDATSIRVGQGFADAPPQILGFEPADEAALLIEYQAGSAEDLTALERRGADTLTRLPLRADAAFSTDPTRRALAWKLRKGLYASVAGARPAGTTALLEDIVVPVPRLADTCEGLQELFTEHGYRDSVIFGHAKDGNIHFMLTDRFDEQAAMRRFERFTDGMVEAPGSDMNVGLDRLLGEVERTVHRRDDGFARSLVERLGARGDDCALVVLTRSANVSAAPGVADLERGLVEAARGTRSG